MSSSTAGAGRLRRRAFRLEYATLTWMAAEAAVAITAGLLAASIALVGFGLDSVIELFSATIVIWQLRGEITGQDRETRAVRLIGATFFALAAYLAIDSIRDLATGAQPRQSIPGLAVPTTAARLCTRRLPQPHQLLRPENARAIHPLVFRSLNGCPSL